MLPAHHLVTFLITIAIIILVPGPSVLFVVSRGVALGRRAALVTVAGNSGGFVVQLTAVAIGIGAIVARSAEVYTVLKLIGAAYLVYLGVRNVRERHALAAVMRPEHPVAGSTARTVREGFLVGVTNPKGVIMFTAILPGFVDRAQGHVTLQLATLGLIAILFGLISDSGWALASGTARQWLGRSQRRLEWLSGAGGVTLIGLGIGLALTGRRS